MPQPIPVAPSHATRALVDVVLEEMSRDLDEISADLADAIHHSLSELDDDLRTWTGQSVRANLGLAVTMLRETTAPSSAVAPPEALGYAREYVRRGLDLALLQRAYRIAQAQLLRLWLERLRGSTDDAGGFVAAIGYLSDWLFASVDEVERQLAAAYVREREQWVRGAAAMRAAEVRALLGGAPLDVAETSRRLDYELERDHVAFVVFGDSAGGDEADAQARFAAMERLATEVCARLGGHAPLVVPQGGDRLACWVGLRGAPDLAALAGYVPADGLRVAVGSCGFGVDGFRAGHREALLARRVARLAPSERAGCTLFTDVALEALAIGDREQAERFVRRELGPLAAEDDAACRLRATLRTFLEEGSSFVRAARRLGVHENTVTYRVRRAEELLGHAVAERQLELRVALRLAPVV